VLLELFGGIFTESLKNKKNIDKIKYVKKRKNDFYIYAGDVVLAAALDRELVSEHVVSVEAFDSPSHGPPLSGYTRVIVRVLDANDQPPILSVHSLRNQRQRFSVPENAPAGSFVAHLSVSDRDTGVNAHVSCQLTDGADAFQLMQLTGVVEYKLVSSRVFDREERDSYTVIIACLVRST